jgi:excisionase family DNA binding protein
MTFQTRSENNYTPIRILLQIKVIALTNTFDYFIFESMNDFISIKTASEKLGLSIRRVQALITSGRLPAEKIGNSYVVREQSLKLAEDRPADRRSKL